MRVFDDARRVSARYGAPAFAMLIVATGPVSALPSATASNSVTVSTTVPTSCTLTARQDMRFLSTIVQTTGQSYDAEGIMRINCTNGSVFGLSLPPGPNDTGAQRRMTDGSGNYLLYDVFASSADRSSGTPRYPSGTVKTGLLGDGTDHDTTFYGRVPTQSTPAVGNYTDQLTVTVDW